MIYVIRRNMKKIILWLVCFIILVFTLIFLNINKNKVKEDVQTTKIHDSVISINGDFVKYISLGEEYKEEGASAFDKDSEDISEEVNIAYFKDGTQFFSIDTSEIGVYQVTYSIGDNVASKIVIIYDDEAPIIEDIPSVTIDKSKVFDFDVNNGVVASDNSGDVSIKCDNILKEEAGEYIIKCEAIDKYGNKSIKKRLVKVS